MIEDIKEEIGRRILDARKSKGLTRKALAELTDDLKQSRINNWERGDRTPGPQEVIQLSKALDVSAAYLMCLTEQKQADPKKSIPGLGLVVPLLNVQEAINPGQSLKNTESKGITYIPLGVEISDQLSKSAFALKMPDASMVPEFNQHDILIVDPEKEPQPGQFVVAHVAKSEEVIIRRYKQLSASQPEHKFELLAENKHWADIKDCSQCQIVGTARGLMRVLD